MSSRGRGVQHHQLREPSAGHVLEVGAEGRLQLERTVAAEDEAEDRGRHGALQVGGTYANLA